MKPTPEPGPSLDTVQAMRAVAATSVVLAHVPFIGTGVFGVDIFFVISGFIVAYVTAGGADGFFRKRIARIVPLYWTATLGIFCVALLAPSLLQSTTADPLHLLQSLFFVPYARANGDVMPLLFLGWTLNYEMFFYLVYAAALRIDRARAPEIAGTTLLALVATGQWLAPAGVLAGFYTAQVLAEFALGLLAFRLWQHRRAWLARVPAILAAALALAMLALMSRVDTATTAITVDNRLLPFGVPALVFFLCVLSLQGRWRMPMLLVMAGDASYSLYLLHPYLLQLVDRKLVPMEALTPVSAVAALLSVTACLALAWLSFRYFEKPANRWLRSRLIAPCGDARGP